MSRATSDTSGDLVLLVDEADVPLGTAPKLDVHRDGRLHRAVSVVLFDGYGRVLLQRRAAGKYHSPGLWSNTACGHPRPGETVLDAARRRLRDEMGVADCALESCGRFTYRASLGGGLSEHELDHVVVGRWAGTPVPDAAEVDGWRWEMRGAVLHDVALRPERYTAWLWEVLVRARAPGSQGVGVASSDAFGTGAGSGFGSSSPATSSSTTPTAK